MNNTLKAMLDPGAYVPVRANEDDADASESRPARQKNQIYRNSGDEIKWQNAAFTA